MKKVLFILLALVFTLGIESMAQEQKLTRKERRELQKQKQKELEAVMAAELEVAIDNKKWVIEAHTLANKRGESVPVNSTLNFIAMEGDEAFVQLGSDSGLGPNGVGGVSVRTKVTKYDIKKNEKKGTYYIHIFASSAIGTFDIRMDCNASGQMASATVQGNSSSRVRYSGQVVPLSKSTVYKGTPLF
jgi:hypothetical protein